MDQLEIGLYSAFAVYGVIAIWTVLARLKWLPATLARFVQRPLNGLERIPLLGRVVSTCRRHPLSSGLVLAVLAGCIVPSLLIQMFWAGQLALIAGAVWLGLRYGSADSAVDEVADPVWDHDSEWSAGRGRTPRA
jgi:hypothetical protein